MEAGSEGGLGARTDRRRERVWLDSGIKGALQGCNMDNEEWRDGLGSKRKASRGSDEFLDGRMTGNKNPHQASP